MTVFFFFSSRRRHTRFDCDWSSDVCSSDLSGASIISGCEDVGYHYVVEPGCQRFGSRGTHRCAVSARVRRGGVERLRIDIDRVDPRGAELCCGDRQYTRPAAVVEDTLAAAQFPLEKAQHEPRGGMAACAERQPGVEPNHGAAIRRRRMPARTDPEACADLPRRKLRLTAAHPVLIL